MLKSYRRKYSLDSKICEYKEINLCFLKLTMDCLLITIIVNGGGKAHGFSRGMKATFFLYKWVLCQFVCKKIKKINLMPCDIIQL